MKLRWTLRLCVLGLVASLSAGRAMAAFPPIPKVWSGTTTRVLVVRVSFSDVPFPYDTAHMNGEDAQVNKLYSEMSRNTFNWDIKLYDHILTTPGTAASYSADGGNSLRACLGGLVTAAGLRKGTDYDIIVMAHPRIPIGYAGTNDGQGNITVNGNYFAASVGHELGHALGLLHAHSIFTGTTDMFGTPGDASQVMEYGDPYDIMGIGGGEGHFSMISKWRLGWIDQDEVKEVTSSGTYRIYAHDNGLHKGRLLCIRVPSGNPNYAYWFEYRTSARMTLIGPDVNKVVGPLDSTAFYGASVLFQGYMGTTDYDPMLMDMTPGAKAIRDNDTDAVMTVGKSFKDKYGVATFKTLAINTGSWNENGWVDVQVNLSSTPVGQGAVKEVPAKDDFAAGTNPSTGAVTFIMNRPAAEVLVYSPAGSLVSRITGPAGRKITWKPLAHPASGVYAVKVSFKDGGSLIRQIVVNR